jgi:PAS domain S-box-containing protein
MPCAHLEGYRFSAELPIVVVPPYIQVSDTVLPHTIPLPTEPAIEHQLIDAVIATNEAPTLTRAFQVLADAGLALLGSDHLWVVVWSEDLATGEVVAAAGRASARLGERVISDSHVLESVATGEPYAGPPILDGLSPEAAAKYSAMATIVRVPLLTESCHVSFHAAWEAPLSGGEASEAALLLHTLTRLTTLAERTLREREQDRLENVLEGVTDCVVLTGGDQVRLNAAARALLAVPEGAEFRSAMFDPRTLDGTPIDVELDKVPGQTAIATGWGRRFTIRATALDGRELVLDGSISPVASGSVIVFRDVTDEHLRNQLNQETLNALFDAIPTAISVARPDSREIVAVNRAFCELVGRATNEIIGLRPPFPWWGEDEADPDAGFVPGTSIDRVYRRPDGRPSPARLSVRAIPGDDGETALVLTLIEDLAEDRRMHQQLVQSGKLAAIGELAAGVAHEINNPLFAILGLTEFLLKESEAGSKAHTRLELIQQTGLEIKEIVRALLDFARENAEERYVVSLEDVVRSTVDLVRRTNAHKGVELIDDYDGSDVCVNASPNQLKQIFLNLIANARQAMPGGGIVTVDVRREGELAIATVTDNGPGIEPAVAERIFEPFFTTKRLTGGTGLGLSVSLGIAEAHGGRLTVASDPDAGSTFTLCLPAEERGAA